MSDKIIRDEILRSHRYNTLSSDTAKLLFMHLLLSSDHFSNAEATSTALTIIMGRSVTEEIGATLISELADKDLVRPYSVDGKRYVHIPRSRQRIRYPYRRHPLPPANIEDQEIKQLREKVGLKSDSSREYSVGSKEKLSQERLMPTTRSPVDNFPVTTLKQPTTFKEHWLAKGKEIGLTANSGESTDHYLERVIEYVREAKA